MMVKGQDSVKKHINYFEEVQKLVLCEEYDRESHISPLLLEKEEIGVEKFKGNIERATTLIKQQAIEKVVLARQLKVKFNEDISTEYVLQRLLKEQPTSYTYILEESISILSALPQKG
ncbi:chorismate-binding protein [Priestia megaterium]